MHVEYDNSDYQSSIDFITYGQVFLYCGIPYIKTDKVGNAVNLLDGREKGFAEGILVEPVKAKVVIQHLDMEAM